MAKVGRKPVIRSCPKCGLEFSARQMQVHSCQAREPEAVLSRAASAIPIKEPAEKELKYEPFSD